MGNCIRKGSSAQWGGEDWGSFGSGNKTRTRGDLYDEEPKNYTYTQEKSVSIDGESKDDYLSSSLAGGTEVKIKVSKKQLEQLLIKADSEGLTVQEVLARLMDVGDQFEAHRRSWSPDLQSIPE
ncbi:hypothetical protein BUALT_Bualt03G0116900 [Buddleja alternifolia]|uniref:Uncharacterized protein n=1 Tax=Buddleja alternifolia TaxID=168488 RepID=A0AAV6XTG3_9LAMI|nr:hypothetical protein BUALT_Bualt03G0116900 [Buddleja alternifolia]